MSGDAGRLVDIRRRVGNLIRVGTVAEVDLPRARVRVEYAPGARTELLPWLTARAGADRTWWAPTVGEQVVLLSPSGDLAAAVVLPGLYQLDAPPPWPDGAPTDAKAVVEFSDGARVVYDVEAHTLSVTLPAGGRLEVAGDVAVDGGVAATGDVRDHKRTMDEMRRIYNDHTHPAPGGATSAPNEKM